MGKPWVIVAVFYVASVIKIARTEITVIPGQARPDDPHACVWFTGLNESSVFRCCDGYFKTDATNLTERCTECQTGSYGFFCQNKCNCENSGTCNTVDGSCRCSERYFGNNCEYHCNCQNGAPCMNDGRCSCAEGFYGKLCQTFCSCPKNSWCDSEGECICKDGFYGSSCLPCNCSKFEQCDQFSGLCYCKPGYHGDNCDKQCTCFNRAYCGNGHLDNCICQLGWAGSECTNCDTTIVELNGRSFCEDKCLHCYNGHLCSVENGDCWCSPGWQGNRCDQICDEGFFGNNCSEVCRCKDGMCDHVTGLCRCKSGWTGEYCEDTCPDNCVMCEDDICLSCKPGWTGERCITICTHGFHGDGCQEPCTECNCSTSCHHVNGSCPEVVRCAEHRCKYQNGKICMENPFTLECQDGWTGRYCNTSAIMTTTIGVSQTDSHDTSANLTQEEDMVNGTYTYIVVGRVACCIVSVVYIVTTPVLLVGILQRKVKGKKCTSDYAKGTTMPSCEAFTSKPYLSTSSEAVTGNINERDIFIGNTVKLADSKQIPIYALVSKHKKKTQQSNAIKEKNEDTEPVEHDALIQSKAILSNSKDDVIRAKSCISPYEIVSLDKFKSKSHLNDNDTKFDKLKGIRVKQDNSNNTDIGGYELLENPKKTD